MLKSFILFPKHYITTTARSEINLCPLCIGIDLNTQCFHVKFRKWHHWFQKFNWYQKAKIETQDIYAFTFTMHLRHNRRSDQKGVFFANQCVVISVLISIFVWYFSFYPWISWVTPELMRNKDMAYNILHLHKSKIHRSHYSDVTWTLWRLKSPTTPLVVCSYTPSCTSIPRRIWHTACFFTIGLPYTYNLINLAYEISLT